MPGNYGYGSDGRGGGWPGLRQVVHIRTTRQPVAPGLKTAIENHHYLTSLDPQSARGKPQALLALARSHWEIENRLHHAKDRSLGEDADRTRNGATIMARLRSLAIALLARIPGHSVPQKQIQVSADPNLALRLMKRKRLPRTQTRH